MKIVEKIDFVGSTKPLFMFENMGMVPLLLPLLHACAIGGGFIAHLEVVRVTEDIEFDGSF